MIKKHNPNQNLFLKKFSKLDKLIELNKLKKINRRNRLEEKLRHQEYYGEIEELFDSVTKISNVHNETMHALQNKTLEALTINNEHQRSFLDVQAALSTLKNDRCKTFAIGKDMTDILVLMGKQTNKQFELISVDPNSNKFKINGIDVSLVPDGIKIKDSIYNFSRSFTIFIIRDIRGDENKIKQLLRDIG